MSAAILGHHDHLAALSRRHLVAAGAGAAGLALLGLPSLHAEQRQVLIPDLLAARPELSIWSAMVRRAGLEARFRSFEPLTLFVPQNEVFDDYPEAAAALRGSSVAGLRRFVLAHAIAGAYPVDALATLGTVTTLAGSDMEFDAVPDANITVWWNDGPFTAATTVTTVPLAAQNGLVYSLRRFVVTGA